MRSLVLFFLAAISFDVGLGRDDDSAMSTENPAYKLMSGLPIPLIGYGIGNLPHDDIPRVVAAQLRAGVFLIDTAHASRNEHLIAEALAEHDGGGGEPRARKRGIGAGPAAAADLADLAPLHVVTKVWYTHLGYARTALSIRESLANLRSASPRQIYVHMLLHWPRCSDEVEWMHCAEEEERLSQHVKDAGPPPHLDKEHAFKHSWRAMEEVYLEHQRAHVARKTQEDRFPEHKKKMMGKEVTPIIASIGVSNFELEDLTELMNLRHPPQIYQGGSWSAFNDPYLMDYIREHGIFYQSYAVISGILQQQDRAPNAYRALTGVAEDLLAAEQVEAPDAVVAEATVILAYFLRKGVGVVPRAAATAHQAENSPRAVAAALRHLSPPHIDRLERALPALLKGEDLKLAASFTNALALPIQLHWVHPDTQEEHLVSEAIEPGSVQVHSTHPGHKFVAYSPDRTVRREFLVDAGYGEMQSFEVEL